MSPWDDWSRAQESVLWCAFVAISACLPQGADTILMQFLETSLIEVTTVILAAWYLEKMGAEVDAFDLKIGGRDHDLVDDQVWSKIKRDTERRKYHGGGVSPPCRTMSGARSDSD